MSPNKKQQPQNCFREMVKNRLKVIIATLSGQRSSKIVIFILALNMSIICKHVHRLELRSLLNVGLLCNATNVPKTPFICYYCISYFGHACLRLNLVLISVLTGKCAIQFFFKLHN